MSEDQFQDMQSRKASDDFNAVRMVVVPNELAKQIDAALDKALAETPEANLDRNYFYNELLCFFDEHGYVPEFSLTKKVGTL